MILAVDKNWAIGCKGALLVHLPGDLKFFKEKTKGKTVIMGRTTMESLPGKKPLPGRKNIVITRNTKLECPGFEVVYSKEEAMERVKLLESDDVFIIGGEQIYREFLDEAKTIYITKILEEFPADRHFVNLDENPSFEVIWQGPIQEDNGVKYQFFRYERIN